MEETVCAKVPTELKKKLSETRREHKRGNT